MGSVTITRAVVRVANWPRTGARSFGLARLRLHHDRMADETRNKTSRWPHVRAALLLVHVAAIMLLALPSTARLRDRARWKDQRTQREITLWADRLQQWGFDTDPQRLEATLWETAQSYVSTRESLSRPLQPYVAVAGVGQPWGMFRSPQRRPGELHVEIDEGEGFRTIYVSRSREHAYLAEVFDHNRFRKLAGRSVRRKRLFDHIAVWVTGRAWQDFPRARRVRVTMMRFDSLSAERRRNGEVPERKPTWRRVTRRPANQPTGASP